jgi:hypothetical protein
MAAILKLNCIGTYDRLYQMSHSAKIVSEIFYTHALAAILAVSVARVIWRVQFAISYADMKIIGIDTE